MIDMAHLKRHMMPKMWKLPRKTNVFVVRPSPGPHPLNSCIPLTIIVRDMLGYADTFGEAKKIISSGKIVVDKKPRKNHKFPVGFMDVIEIPEIKEYYRVVMGTHGLELQKTTEKDTGAKLCRIRGKTTVKGGLFQLNLHDGRNILIKRNMYKVGDTLLISLPDQKILKHYSFEKGVPATIVAGRNIGIRGTVKEIKKKKSMLEKSTVVISTSDGREIQTPWEYVFVGELEPSKPSARTEKEKPAKKTEKKKASGPAEKKKKGEKK